MEKCQGCSRGHDSVTTGGGDDQVTFGGSAPHERVRRTAVNMGAGDDEVIFATAPAPGTLVRLGPGRDRTTFRAHAFASETSAMPAMTIDAGSGQDLFGSPFLLADRTSGPPAGEVADLAAGTVRTRGTSGLMRIQGFEEVRGTPWRDVLLGSDGPNVLQGGERNDVIRGRAGADRADGGSGDDRCDAEVTRRCEHSLS